MNYGSKKVCLAGGRTVEIDVDDLDATPLHALSMESEEQMSAPSLSQRQKQSKAKKKVRWSKPSKSQGRGGKGKPARIYQQQVDTSVVSIQLGTLAEQATSISTGDPLFCCNEKCKAVFSTCSTILDAKKALLDTRCKSLKIEEGSSTQVWICEFCQTPQVIEMEAEELPKSASVDYILAPPEEKTVSEDTKKIIFVVDTSGSMCVTKEVEGQVQLKGMKKRQSEFEGLLEEGDDRYGLFRNGRGRGQQQQKTHISRLQCVQAAVDSQVENLSQRYPKNKVALMTFNNEVTIYGDCTEEPTHCAGDKLGKKDSLAAIGQGYDIKQNVETSEKSIRKKIFELEENGQTCLGPALFTAVHMAAQQRGSQVILCTDGMANIGLGALEGGEGPEAAAEFYEELAREAARRGVTVSTVSITDQEASLENLGRVADATGGSVDRIDPLKLSENFTGILENAVLAVQSQATMLLHQALLFRDTAFDDEKAPLKKSDGSGATSTRQESQEVQRLTKDVGNVFAESEVFFEYSVHPEVRKRAEGLKTIPFQVQISYTRLDGSKCIRVITQTREVTFDQEEAAKDMNHAVLAANCMQRSAKLAQQGDYEKSRLNNVAWGHFMRSSPSNNIQEQRMVLDSWSAQAEQLDSMLQQEQQSESLSGMNMRSMDKSSKRRARSSRRKDTVSSAMYRSCKSSSSSYSPMVVSARSSPSSRGPSSRGPSSRGPSSRGPSSRAPPATVSALAQSKEEEEEGEEEVAPQGSQPQSGEGSNSGWMDWLSGK